MKKHLYYGFFFGIVKGKQKTENRSQKAEVGGQIAEDRGQKAD